MRLLNKSESPVPGGWYYTYTDDKGNEYSVRDIGGLRRLVVAARSQMAMNGIKVPDDLADLVEDQICARLTGDKCTYENKIGDRISQGIHSFARILDAGAAAVGLNTKIEKKARGCSSCAKRRSKLNKLS